MFHSNYYWQKKSTDWLKTIWGESSAKCINLHGWYSVLPWLGHNPLAHEVILEVCLSWRMPSGEMAAWMTWAGKETQWCGSLSVDHWSGLWCGFKLRKSQGSSGFSLFAFHLPASSQAGVAGGVGGMDHDWFTVEWIVIGEITLLMLVSSRKQGKWCHLEHLPSTFPWKRSVTPSLLLPAANAYCRSERPGLWYPCPSLIASPQSCAIEMCGKCKASPADFRRSQHSKETSSYWLCLDSFCMSRHDQNWPLEK